MKPICAKVVGLLTAKTPHFAGKVRLIRGLGAVCKGAYFVESRYGVLMQADILDNTNLWSLLGWYDEVAGRVKELEPGGAFVDIGANAGLFSLLAGKAVGTQGVVIAFEPQREVFHKLVANVRENGLDNVFCFNLALSDVTRPIAMENQNARHTGIASIKEVSSNVMYTGWAVAPRSDLRVVEAILAGRPTTIKIDVEGHEARVLKGIAHLLAADYVRQLIVEIDEGNLNRYGSRASDLYALLQTMGFTPTRGLTNGHYDEIFVRST